MWEWPSDSRDGTDSPDYARIAPETRPLSKPLGGLRTTTGQVSNHARLAIKSAHAGVTRLS